MVFSFLGRTLWRSLTRTRGSASAVFFRRTGRALCALHAGSVVHASASRPRLGNPVFGRTDRFLTRMGRWADLEHRCRMVTRARSTTGLSRAARWNCSTADGRGSAPRKTWIAGQARPSGSPAPRSTSLHPRPGTRKLRDILRGDHWPLVSIEENSLNKSKEVRQSDEAGKAHNLELRDRADAHCVSLVISECGAVTRQTVRLCFQAGIRQRQKAKFAAYAV